MLKPPSLNSTTAAMDSLKSTGKPTPLVSLMLLSYKYRLRPTSTQNAVLEEQLQLCQWTYNTLLNHCFDERKAGRGTPTLRKALTYMASLSEGVTAFVDPRDTSQICSGCGARVMKDLSVRVHVCPMCGLALDRDVKAARNVLKRGLEIGLGRAEYTPDGEGTTTHLSGAGQVASMNQEAHDLSHG